MLMLIRCASLVLLLISSTVLAADPIELRAGRLVMTFEPDLAMLRHVRIGNHLILQGITAPVRDHNWGTVPPNVENVRLQQEQQENGFTLDFDVSCRQREIDFSWHGKITGSAEGQIVFTFDGVARSEFRRNRIGFCVLHGAAAAGARCIVDTVSGESVKGSFPKRISPHQPFQNIRTVSHEIAPDLWAKVRMEGDTFEMEDQRNWTDASFKTYCTPLAIPYPVKIEKGTRISQRIEVSMEGAEKLADLPTASPGQVTLEVTTAVQRMPGIGLRVSSQVETLTQSEIARLRELHLDHLRVDVRPAETSAGSRLRQAAEQAAQLDVKLVVGLHLSENPDQELQNLSAVLMGIRQPATWLLVSADEQQVRATRAFLTQAGQKGVLGRGEDTNFTELNRKRPDPALIDLVSYGMNPQIHAFDDSSMVETLAIQGETVLSARQFIGKRPLMISPITLRPQVVNQASAKGELPPQVDPRQPGLFAADWTLGSVKYLAESGVDSLTYYETIGWLGIMEAASGTTVPERFPSQPGQLFPIYHVLKVLGEFAGGSIYQTTSTDPLSVIALSVRKDKTDCILVANLTPQNQSARVVAVDRELFLTIRRLDAEHSAFEPTADVLQKRDDPRGMVLKLPPYGLAVLEAR